MNILLSYSKRHFDPTKPESEHKFWGSSAQVLAKSLYDTASKLGSVTYIDADAATAEEFSGQEFDLFIGIPRRFSEIRKGSRAKQSIFWAVNMHPAERNQILQDFITHNDLNAKAAADWDMVDVKEISASLDEADYILCVGNITVYNSYLKHGISPQKIKMLNYAVGPSQTPTASSISGKQLVYVSSEIGLRKGFDIVAELLSDPSVQDQDFHLNLVGSPTNDHYAKVVADLKSKLGKKITVHGWVESASEKYYDLLGKADFLIYPALEEGQAGSVLDAVRRGVVPMLSRNTGVDFSPLGNFELSLGSKANLELLNQALAQTPEQMKQLKQKTVEYYQEYHEPFEAILAQTIDDCLSGQLYPKFSLTMPIFNKEQTIIPLLEYLDVAATAYGNIELHIVFDGCKDKTEELVRNHYAKDPGFPVSFDVTPNIFEVRTNNLGLRKGTGRYGVIIQDDNYIYDPNIFFEAATFLDKNPQAAVLGCLAGVNYYPRGTRLTGPGQIAQTNNETYWRQDAVTDPTLPGKFFQVDACMRGPLIIRKSFLEEHGYLDELYIPFYMDDMDLGLRAAKYGQKVYTMLSDVENKSFTIATYDEKRNKFWEDTMKTNTDAFYKRWKPSTDKSNYTQITRTPIYRKNPKVTRYQPATEKRSVFAVVGKGLRFAAHIFSESYCRSVSDRQWKRRMTWIQSQAARVPKGAKVLDIGAGATPYREAFAHTDYTTQDFAQTPNFEYGKIDVVSDITDIPLPDASYDVILCTEVFEHIPYPLEALKEISRLLKPGGRLIFSAPLGSGHHQVPYHFYGGYTRFWYEKFFPENGLNIVSLQPNGGLFAHVIELLWRTHDYVIQAPRSGNNPAKKVIAAFLQVFVYNIPTLVLSVFERRKVIEDFTVCFFCIAEKESH